MAAAAAGTYGTSVSCQGSIPLRMWIMIGLPTITVFSTREGGAPASASSACAPSSIVSRAARRTGTRSAWNAWARDTTSAPNDTCRFRKARRPSRVPASRSTRARSTVVVPRSIASPSAWSSPTSPRNALSSQTASTVQPPARRRAPMSSRSAGCGVPASMPCEASAVPSRSQSGRWSSRLGSASVTRRRRCDATPAGRRTSSVRVPSFHARRERRPSSMVTVQSASTAVWQARRTPFAVSDSGRAPVPDAGGGAMVTRHWRQLPLPPHG